MPALPQGETSPIVQTLFLPDSVDAPSTGGLLPYGLMSVAQMITDTGSRWHTGVSFQGNPCGRAKSTIGSCPDSELDFTKETTADGLGARGAETFAVYANIECSSVGSWDDAEARAAAALTNGEARAIERVFWGGQLDTPVSVYIHPHLASDDELFDVSGLINLQTAADVVITGTVDIVEGLGLLESALAECYPGVGVIHAERSVLAHMAANDLIERNGQKLQTIGGTPIAFGAGYLGTGPDATAPDPGTTWLYATGAITIRRDPQITITSDRTAALDRAVNTLRMFAERSYNISWDCCHFAVNVSLGGVITGTAGIAT